MSFYHLTNTNATWTPASTTRLHRTLKNLELKIKHFKFSGEDPIIIFDFLIRLVEESNTLQLSEEQIIVYIPHTLTNTTACEYRSTSSGNRTGASRTGDAAYQIGNAHTSNEKISIIINGLLLVIQPIVARFRRYKPRYDLTFNFIVWFAHDEGDRIAHLNHDRPSVLCFRQPHQL